MQVAILGSGLSGLAAAHALIRRGLKPVMLDAGREIDPSTHAVVSRMAASEPQGWALPDVAHIKRNETIAGAGIPRKLVFGSDYIYGGEPEASIASPAAKAVMSLAKGGFGNAWGAAVLPADPADLTSDWPREAARLEEHYRAVFRWLPLSAGEGDALGRHFPTYRESSAPLTMPRQAAPFMQALDRLSRPDIAHGLARLAVHAEGPLGCRRCGLCLSGCVYGSIFNPGDAVDALSRAGQLDYRPGHVVERLAETGDAVTVTVRRGETRENLAFSQVFVAFGAVSTTRLMLASLNAYGARISLADSQKFLLPLFRLKGAAYDLEDTHSLAAMFVETRVPELAGNWMHMQISAISDFVLRRLGADRSAFRRIVLAPALRRMLIAWGSLHSAHSARLEVWLRPDGQLDAQEADVRRAQANVRKGLSHFNRLVRASGTWGPSPLVTYSGVGSGNHTGASFPMREAPGAVFESDTLGRPTGWSRTHLVDAASMPSIPATTIALLMMANADRIASQAPLA
jgi:choline dehydrogenase-like flavoprotein